MQERIRKEREKRSVTTSVMKSFALSPLHPLPSLLLDLSMASIHSQVLICT